MRLLSISAGTLLSSALLHAGVTVVAPSGGDYNDIGLAIAAVPDGEIVLVRAGTYVGFTIQNKSVHVIADAGQLVQVHGTIVVSGLAAGKSLTIQGLSVTQFATVPVSTIQLDSCAGSVRVLATHVFPPTPGLTSVAGPPSVLVNACLDVAFDGDEFRGMNGNSFLIGITQTPSLGMSVNASVVSVHDCIIVGGRGIPGLTGVPTGNTNGRPGANGLSVANSVLFESGGSIRGGAGGPGVDGDNCSSPYTHPTFGGSGGAGIELDNPSVVRAFAGDISGGPGGVSGSAPGCTLPPGADGAASIGGSPILLAGSARHLAVVAPAHVSGQFQLHFEGQPGDDVFLALALGRTHTFESVLNGDLLVLPPFRRLRVGSTDANGVLDITLPVGQLPLGVEGTLHNAQGIFRDAGGTLWTSGAALITRLQ